jgi:hypothetical protein
MRRSLAVVAATLLLGGCYHATVRTGINAGPERIHRSMASGWLYGLVPPSTVEAERDCGNRGVAVVETQLSFLNQLVSSLTLGIYTPMAITVICGEGPREDEESPPEGEESPLRHP